MEKRTLYKEGTYKKGNLHTHTTWSDGMHTPAETAKHYRSKKQISGRWYNRRSLGEKNLEACQVELCKIVEKIQISQLCR